MINIKKNNKGKQLKRVQILQYLNSILTELTSSGWLLNTRVIQKLKKKNNLNLQDIEELKQLKNNVKNNQDHLQDCGQFKNFKCEKITLEKLADKNNVQEDLKQSQSQYFNKIVVSAGDMQIILKTKE